MEEKKSLPPTWKKAAAGFAAIAALATLILACRAIGTYLHRRQEGDRLFAAGNYIEAKALYRQTGNDKMAALCAGVCDGERAGSHRFLRTVNFSESHIWNLPFPREGLCFLGILKSINRSAPFCKILPAGSAEETVHGKT